MKKRAKQQRKTTTSIGALSLKLLKYVALRCLFLCKLLVCVCGVYTKKNKLITLGFCLFGSIFIAIAFNVFYRQHIASPVSWAVMPVESIESIDLVNLNTISTAQARPNMSHRTHIKSKASKT